MYSSLYSLVLLFIFTSSCLFRVTAVWTEEDEARRIAMIMDEERKQFEAEKRMQQIINSRARGDFNSQRSELSSLQSPLSSPVIQEEVQDNWCYHCTSPIAHLSDKMKKTIKDFLRIRRTSYPTKVATPECISARNFSLLHKQNCKHRYCQTLALVDHNEGASFVLRGCAENFGAINTNMLEKQEENKCTRLHEKLDIKECICKERKYCYANSRTSSSNSISYCFILLLTLLFLSA